jgi:predicted oxidoreductase
VTTSDATLDGLDLDAPLPLSAAPRPVGRSTLCVLPLAYGCWRFTDRDVRRARARIEAALASGITLFDHADIYGGAGAAEDLFGRVLAEAPYLRDRMVLATKAGVVPGVPYDASRRHLLQAAEASLRRLRVDVIDLFQIHRPDLLTHPAEVADALATLQAQGKIRAIGVSNYSRTQYAALQHFLPCAIASHQTEISCWWLDAFRNGVLDQCQQFGVTPLAWSPLAGGHLALAPEAARAKADGERLTGLIDCLDRLAAREGVPRTAVALAFLLAHPAGIIPIIGTRQPERIRETRHAFTMRLTRADWYAIFTASQGKRLP